MDPTPLVPVAVDPSRPDGAVVADAAGALDAGGLVAFPTETVYGLGAAVDRPDAVARVFSVKGRPATDPLIVHVAGADEVAAVVAEMPDVARALADAFWPGPLTLVLPRAAGIGDDVTAGGGSVAVRVPAHPVALALLRAARSPVAAPSANRFGRVSPTAAAHVAEELGDRLDPARDRILDGGPTTLGIESTVVDLSTGAPRVLRHGGVPWEDLEAVVGPVEHPERQVVDEEERADGPGRFLRHYAPGTPLFLVEGDAALLADVAAALAARGLQASAVGLPGTGPDAAPVLYATLRDADDAGAAVLLVTPVRPDGLGRAVNDRLYRAAHGRVVTDAGPATVDRIEALARR